MHAAFLLALAILVPVAAADRPATYQEKMERARKSKPKTYQQLEKERLKKQKADRGQAEKSRKAFENRQQAGQRK